MVCSSEFHETVVIVLVFLVKNHFTGKCSLAECWAVFLLSFFLLLFFLAAFKIRLAWSIRSGSFLSSSTDNHFRIVFLCAKICQEFSYSFRRHEKYNKFRLPTGFGALSQFDDPIKKLHLHESENIRNKKENFVHRAQPKKRVMLHHFALWLTNFIRIWIHNLDENRVNTLRNSICARKVRSCLLKAEN